MSTHSVNMPAFGLALCLVAGAALADGPGLGKPLNEADIQLPRGGSPRDAHAAQNRENALARAVALPFW
jgi:hypothetical protein